MKLIYLLLIALAGYSALFFFSAELISPDDLIFDFFSTHLAATGQLGYLPPGDIVFEEEGFIPRYFVYGQEGRVFPRKFPGFIIFWAGLKRIIPLEAAQLVNPLCAVLAILLLFLIGREVFPGGRTAIRAAVFLAVTPVFIRRAYAYNPTLFNLSVFLAALFFLLRAIRRGQLGYYLLFGLFGGAMLWTRPTNIIYLAALIVLARIERRRIERRFFLAALGAIVIGGGGLLLFNRAVYGGFFNLGYTATYARAAKAVSATAATGLAGILDYLQFHPRVWLLHLKNTPAGLALGFPLLLLALLGFIAPREKTPLSATLNPEGDAGPELDRPVRFKTFYLVLFFGGLFFFSNFGTYGHESNEFTVHSSFLRYLMPVICLLPLFAAHALEKVKITSGVLMTSLAGFSLLIALLAPAGLIETMLQSRYYREAGKFLRAATDERTVFFTHYWDKVVFPERMVYTLGAHFPLETVGGVIEKVERTGYRAAYPTHPADRMIGDFILEHYEVEEIAGPQLLSPLDRLAARFIPAELYPVRLYLIRGAKASPAAGSAPPIL